MKTSVITSQYLALSLSLSALSSVTHAVPVQESPNLIDVSCLSTDGKSLTLEHTPGWYMDGVVTLDREGVTSRHGARVVIEEEANQLPSLFTVNKYFLYGDGPMWLTVTKRPVFGRGGCGRGGCNDVATNVVSAKLVQGEVETVYSCAQLAAPTVTTGQPSESTGDSDEESPSL